MLTQDSIYHSSWGALITASSSGSSFSKSTIEKSMTFFEILIIFTTLQLLKSGLCIVALLGAPMVADIMDLIIAKQFAIQVISRAMFGEEINHYQDDGCGGGGQN